MRDHAAFSVMKDRRQESGFSLVEVLIVVVITAILITCAIPTYSFLRNKAGNATCISHLRVIGVSLNSYLLDHDNVWPQVPENLLDEEEQEMKWWVSNLKSYGMAQKYLLCPSDEGAWEKSKNGPDRFIGSYVITTFDDLPSTAFRWNQPWVIERGSFHDPKVGPNMFMPDGSVQQGMSLMPQ